MHFNYVCNFLKILFCQYSLSSGLNNTNNKKNLVVAGCCSSCFAEKQLRKIASPPKVSRAPGTGAIANLGH